MINGVTSKVNIDEYIMRALKEDITSEDVTTNAVTVKKFWDGSTKAKLARVEFKLLISTPTGKDLSRILTAKSQKSPI